MTGAQDELDLALELADEADRISLAHFRSERLLIETKPDMTPVSEADRQVEQAIRERLSQARPRHAVLGEEFGGVSNAAVRWIVDPIDGTKRYIRGVPLFATLIALEEEGELTLGVVSAPALGRRWWAARGLGAFADGRPIRVSGVKRLADAHVSLASLDNWLGRGLFDQLGRIASTAWSSSGYGDFWSHMLVAEGAVSRISTNWIPGSTRPRGYGRRTSGTRSARSSCPHSTKGAYEAKASVPIVQALHHGNSHREQVCSILTGLGIQPPDLQAWTWAEATGRARELRPQA